MAVERPQKGKGELTRGLRRALAWLGRVLLLALALLGLGGSGVPLPRLFHYQLDGIVAPHRFDLVGWELRSVPAKLLFPVGLPAGALSPDEQRDLVRAYLSQAGRRDRLEWELERLYARAEAGQPPAEQVAALRRELDELTGLQGAVRPLAEAILERQVADALREMDLTVAGVVWPPVKFRWSASPYLLTVSPRAEIRVQASRDLLSGLPLELQVRLEDQVDGLSTEVVSLIEATGGYGAYPAMVLESTNLRWTVETVVHEWVHNYLIFRPLGLRYFDSPQMRSINETVADIVGEETGLQVLRAHYPDWLPPPPAAAGTPEAQPPDPGAFQFGREMRLTREGVDALLAAGQVVEAEAYMEERRQFFAENGYFLRKLNQAYFAFHGTYATGPAASAVDPVGQGLTALRRQVGSLREFVDLVAVIRTPADFERLMAEQGIALPDGS